MTQSSDDESLLIASQGELVGSITHDLKGMLSGVEGGLYFIDSGIKKDKKERLDEGLAMLKRNLARLREAVASVLFDGVCPPDAIEKLMTRQLCAE